MKFIRTLKASNEMAKNHLKWLVYQVNNGGMLQYCFNGYADDLLKYAETHNIVQELEEMGCPAQGIEAIEYVLKLLNEMNPPTCECPDCNGSGELETEDEDGDIETSLCDNCHGDGEIEVSTWAECDNQSWMNRFDNWFYKLNMKELDDWTEQSHNHSYALDMIEQNKKNQETK